MSILSAIRHFVGIIIIHSMYTRPGRKFQLSMCLVTVKAKDEDGNSQGRVVQHRSGICMLPGEYYCRACIATAAVNESM